MISYIESKVCGDGRGDLCAGPGAGGPLHGRRHWQEHVSAVRRHAAVHALLPPAEPAHQPRRLSFGAEWRGQVAWSRCGLSMHYFDHSYFVLVISL